MLRTMAGVRGVRKSMTQSSTAADLQFAMHTVNSTRKLAALGHARVGIVGRLVECRPTEFFMAPLAPDQVLRRFRWRASCKMGGDPTTGMPRCPLKRAFFRLSGHLPRNLSKDRRRAPSLADHRL